MNHHLGSLAAIVLLAGCTQTHSTVDAGSERDAAMGARDAAMGARDAAPVDAAEPLEDDGGPAGEDAGPGEPDGGSIAEDAGPPPEPCGAPGTIESVGCGLCGTQDRFCTSTGVWEYAPCVDGVGAVCEPGTPSSEPCGMCGTQRLLCDTSCQWVPFGSCMGETGECLPGQRERDMSGCAEGSVRGRTCASDCTWSAYGVCVEVPTDFDGDGDPFATDCDETDPAVSSGSTRPCGGFLCGTSVREVQGIQTCGGPDWGLCERPADCDDAECTPFANEWRDCATECGGYSRQTRRCLDDGTWDTWSPCGGVVRPRPPECDAVTASSCGACDEGTAYQYCDGQCAIVTTECMETGCTPGATTRSTSGCPDGHYRETECTAACTPTTSACVPYPPDVDIVILVDVTGSHTALIRANAAALARDLAAVLLADADVRVGVATFADFPVSPYGSSGDLPFRGLLAPSSDAATVESTLATLDGMGGADGPESGVHALYELAGGPPHPASVPFTCAAGLAAGACWRPGSQRVIVMVTDVTQHNGPDPLGSAAIHAPYTGLTPPPATWVAARDALTGASVALFAIVPETGAGDLQLQRMTEALGQDPAAAVVTYPIGTSDISPAIRTTASRIAAYVGL